MYGKIWYESDFPNKIWEFQENEEKNLIYKNKWIDHWWSNGMNLPITINKINYPTLEHYIYCEMIKDKSTIDIIRSIKEPFELNYYTKNKEIVDNWDNIKFNIIYQGLLVKCKLYPLFLQRILDYPLYFINWNNWKDEELGVNIYNKTGKNIIGVLLQYIKMNVYEL